MKLTNAVFAEQKEGEVTTIPFIATINKLIDQDLGVKNSLKIYSLIDILNSNQTKYNKIRFKIYKKFGKEVSEGSYTMEGVEKEQMEGFIQEMNELTNTEFEFDMEPIDLSNENVTIKPREIAIIRGILKMPEVTKEVEDGEESTGPEEVKLPEPEATSPFNDENGPK